MPADCVFCSIASGATEAGLVLEDRDFLAFLDSRPLFPGHCLLIPRTHYPTLLDLPAHLVGRLFPNAQTLCAAMEQALGAEGSFVAVNNRVSQSIPHLHVHVVPRRRKDGLKGFFWPRGKYRDASEMEVLRLALSQAVGRLRSS